MKTFLIALAGFAVSFWARVGIAGCGVALEVQGPAVFVNGVPVTGDGLFPLSFVLDNLKVTPEQVIKWRGQTVVSLGEGFSSVASYLARHKVSAHSVDLWYGREDLPVDGFGAVMRAFQQKKTRSLIRADAARLPFADGSIDVFLGHLLLNNLSVDDAVRVLREVRRTLRIGGEARFVGLPKARGHELAPLNDFFHSVEGEWTTDIRRIKKILPGTPDEDPIDFSEYALTVRRGH